MHPFRKHLEELRPGDTIVAGPRRVTQEDVEHFAEFTGDTFYAHMDAEAAAANPLFGERVAHGYLIVSLAAGLFVDPDPGPVLANFGVDNLRFLTPVKFGDELTVTLTCKQLTPRDTADYGEVRWDADVTRQDGESVARYDVLTLVAKDVVSRLEGRVALVTGGARGIGAATALRLASEGADVALLDLDEAAAAQTAKEIAEQTGRRALGLGADVADAGQVTAAVDRVAEELGSLGVLVNNAGVTRDNLLFKMTEDDWDTVMAVHLRGFFLASKAAQRHMVAARWGRIISLSSVSALGTRGQVNYSAAKAGLQGATRTLAIELGPFGITANTVAPGFVVTEMTAQLAERLGSTLEDFTEERADITPVRRAGTPADIAAVIAFLASDDASFITGQTIYVDGGRRL